MTLSIVIYVLLYIFLQGFCVFLLYNPNMVKSAYIHIPFCRSKCHYCSFVSFCNLDFKKDYLKMLAKEINSFYENEMLNTVYFGGGTPSLLSVSEFENILRIFKISNDAEITTELNPETLDYSYLRGLYDIGINRISLGCQTFNDCILKQINRRHNAGQVINSVKLAQDAGFSNISLDFIYGLPNQTPEMFLKDLKIAVELGIQHISLYGLKIEEGSYFYNNMPDNLADDDMQADMFLGAIDLLKNLNFNHYEVSNFSVKGFESRHNLNYWNNEEYYGFGVAAHGYKNGVRYSNKCTIDDYLSDPFTHSDSKLLTQNEKLEEEIFLGFRKMDGICVEDISQKYGINFCDRYNDVLKKYEGLNLLKRTNKGYSLTDNGILVSNVILADFLEE